MGGQAARQFPLMFSCSQSDRWMNDKDNIIYVYIYIKYINIYYTHTQEYYPVTRRNATVCNNVDAPREDLCCVLKSVVSVCL